MTPEQPLYGLKAVEAEINLSDSDIQEYDRRAIEEGKPTFGEMLPLAREFLSKSKNLKFGKTSDAWMAPRTELVEELYLTAKAIEHMQENGSSSTD